jgi:hypothetical protein
MKINQWPFGTSNLRPVISKYQTTSTIHSVCLEKIYFFSSITCEVGILWNHLLSSYPGIDSSYPSWKKAADGVKDVQLKQYSIK